MFQTAKQLIEECKRRNVTIGQLVVEDEFEKFRRNKETIYQNMEKMIQVMEKSGRENLNVDTVVGANMINGFAKKTYEYSKKADTICGETINEAMAMAFSTFESNSGMGRIIATPTAGSSGILPAAILLAEEKFNPEREDLIDAVLSAVGIGQMIGMYACFSGAEGGCQAETGSAAAMSAGLLVQLKGGSVEEQLEAASISLINILGLICDPIAGLVEYPCTFRNAMGIVNAMISADLAMAGTRSVVPFDEVCKAMGEVGKKIPEAFRETGIGGLAGTRTGIRIKNKHFGKETIGEENSND